MHRAVDNLECEQLALGREVLAKLMSAYYRRGMVMGTSVEGEWKALLEEAMAGKGEGSPVGDVKAQGEAERLAQAAEAPKRRKDGEPVGSKTPRAKPLTPAQERFCELVIRGNTLRSSYRQAFNNYTASDSTVSANANKLMRDERIAKRVDEGWGETVEHLIEDVQASKRYVLKGLLALSKGANQEGTKLKALEMMGKAVGMFVHQEAVAKVEVSTEQLRKELASHLKMLERIKPTTVITDAEPVRVVERVNESV